MAYSELIKHFQNIRTYMHEFYIYGFKSRNNMNHKSLRSYDNEKRRLESYLKEYMSFQYTSSKTVFLSIDTRQITHNPLYKTFQSKSFTDKDITLYFYILDILYNPELALTFQDTLLEIDHYFAYFTDCLSFDESTLRKKLNEFVNIGLLTTYKSGKKLYYHRVSDFPLDHYKHALHFYSEIFPVGVIGSYMLSQIESPQYFSFKHHYITYAIDSEIIALLFEAMSQHKTVLLTNQHNTTLSVIPLRIYISSQNGRCHLLAYTPRYRSIKTYRVDYIKHIKLLDSCSEFDHYRERLNLIQKHIWSVQCHEKQSLEHISFIIEILEYETYILQRLEREKRGGTILQIDKTHYQFSIDIYDTYEILPWIRTFIGRIKQLNFSNRTIENQFKEDMIKMYQLYHIKGEDI